MRSSSIIERLISKQLHLTQNGIFEMNSQYALGILFDPNINNYQLNFEQKEQKYPDAAKLKCSHSYTQMQDNTYDIELRNKNNNRNKFIGLQYRIYTIIVKTYLMQSTPQPQHLQHQQQQIKHASLQSVTVLLIFLIIVINQIFLISLIAILLKKIKFIIKSTAKKYYYFVIFYIVSKLSLCIFLQIKIISGIADQFVDFDSATVEKIFDNSLVFADCSIVELFLIAFQHYLALSFSVFGNKKTEKTIRILMQGAQIVIFFTIMIPLLLFNINIIKFETLNLFTMTINCLNVIAFIAAFFFMNFKMTGLMLQKKSSQLIKKVYALLLGLLVSRLIMSALQVWVQINITNGSFQDFITIIEKNQNQYVVLGLCFIAYLLIILLTEGLPLIMSLRQSLVMALTQVIKSRSRSSSFQQSILTSDNNIKQQLFSSLDMVQQQDVMSHRSSIISPPNTISKLQNPDQLQCVDIIMSIRDDFVAYKAKWIKNNKYYFVKKLGNISSYIIQQLLNEIQDYKKYEVKIFNPIKVIQKSSDNNKSEIFLVEKYLSENLLTKMDKLKPDSIKQKLDLALNIAKAISIFHNIVKIGHGVLHPKNIMFDEDGDVILTGFGMESLKKYLSLTSDYSNISFYTATELFGGNRQKTVGKPTKPADVYSFGVLFYQIISGNYKYRSLTLPEIRKKFVVENTRPKIPENIDEDLKQIMRKCWQENPESRPEIKWVVTNLQTIRSRY